MVYLAQVIRGIAPKVGVMPRAECTVDLVQLEE